MIEDWIRDKYTSDTPDDARFKDIRGEYHSSNMAQCHRRWYWDFKRETEDDWSVYFELGRMFERAYGRALRHEYGEDRVKQDVQVEIRRDDFTIVGESDWVVFKEDVDRVEKVILHEDGSRECILEDEISPIRKALEDVREQINTTDRLSFNADHVIDNILDSLGEPVESRQDYRGQVEKVIETKTTKKIEWRRKYGHKPQHLYQVQTYMWAMDAPGEIVYMTRNELDEMTFTFDRDDKIENDIHIRALQHHRNLDSDEIPDTDPIKERRCKYCEWNSECKEIGGTRWD